MRLSILDCTLRDGGYVNDWNFDEDTALAVRDALYNSGVRWIEIGILGTNAIPGKQTKFSSFDEIKPLLKGRKEDCHYAVMVTTAASDKFEYPECSEDTPDVIRIAYFKPELEKTCELAKGLMQKGYCVFLQAMATFMYDKNELIKMVRDINNLHPYAFYMVDSFSTMYPADVIEIRDSILKILDNDILFGFHAHNNIQMAFSNVQEFMKTNTTHELMIDSSIFGMGRGAGNVPTELLMDYLYRVHGQKYDISSVLSAYQDYIEPIYREYGWGYTMPYYLTAVQTVNSAWGWYFMNKGIDRLEKLEAAIKMIPEEWTYTLNTSIGAEIVNTVKGENNG